MNRIFWLLAWALLLFRGDVHAQIPVELMAGDKKASFDLMFFKFFKNAKEENSKFLFFSRTRSTVDYKITTRTNLPAFGLTEAISYNHPKWKGFAPVAVIQIFNRGVFPKSGIQYVHLQKNFTVFSWFVCEALKNPDLDGFLLLRFTPELTNKMNLYTQIESSNSFPTRPEEAYNLTQRFRLGLMLGHCQFGAAADVNEFGKQVFTNTYNVGGFVRYEFK